MAKVLEQLTDAACKRLTKPGLHVDGGVYLSVTPRKDGSVTKSWVWRYSAPDGRRREMGLGGYPEVTLAAARRLAAVKRDEVRAGGDPVAAKALARREAAQAAAKATTFRECCETFTAAHQACWRNTKHAKQWSATLKTYAYPVFGDWPVSTIDTSAVVKALDAIWLEKPETARRLRGRIERVLDWAKVRGYREGENPARWRGHLDKALPVIPKARRIKHHAALPFEQAGAFMVQLRTIPGVAARALEFAILTAARTGEVLGARWAEIDLKGRIWTIPAARMKAGREHRVPLSVDALEVLRGLRSASGEEDQLEFVFANELTVAPLSNMAMLMTLRRMGRRDLTVHGFRSTFRDWTAERTGFAREVAEAARGAEMPGHVEARDLAEYRRQVDEDPTRQGVVARLLGAFRQVALSYDGTARAKAAIKGWSDQLASAHPDDRLVIEACHLYPVLMMQAAASTSPVVPNSRCDDAARNQVECRLLGCIGSVGFVPFADQLSGRWSFLPVR